MDSLKWIPTMNDTTTEVTSMSSIFGARQPKKTNLRRWNVRLKDEEIAAIDRLMKSAGATEDAEFFRMLVDHWAETHPSTKTPKQS